jgi:hypothetical protein
MLALVMLFPSDLSAWNIDCSDFSRRYRAEFRDRECGRSSRDAKDLSDLE